MVQVRAFELLYKAPRCCLRQTSTCGRGGKHEKKKIQNRPTNEEMEKGNPRVALKRLGMNAPGSSFLEGNLREADEPIP